jgi:hypothetical protein
MRVQHFLAFAAAATLSLSACAEPSIVPSANMVAVQGSTASFHRMTPDEAASMVGQFRLTDGRTMKVSSQDSRLFVVLDGKREELVAVGPKRFTTRQGNLDVAFDKSSYPDAVTVGETR